MFFKSTQTKSLDKGFTLVEVIVTSAIITLVFGGLLAGVKFTFELLGRSQASAGALSLANERLEYIRSLPYDSVGTIGSPPYGQIPQTSTTTLNGIEYTERVLITYIDDPADGLAGADENVIFDDYKLVKIEYTWELRGEADSLALVSNIVPVGIETTTGGGTIKVLVFDAETQPVEDATVHFLNNTLSTTTDTNRFTNADGFAFLSGAPAGANYEITVTKAGYSTDGTYVATTSNPTPDVAPVSVALNSVSTMSFAIDQTSDLLVKTLAPATVGTFEDTFENDIDLATSSNVVVNSGFLELTDVAGVYDSSGTVLSTSTTPATVAEWESLYFDSLVSGSTTARVSLYYDNGGSLDLVPTSDLSGNDVGFVTSPIDISSLDPVTYPTLAIGATLATTDAGFTPQLGRWGLTYVISEPIIPGIDFRLFGQKTIGKDAASKPILKYDEDLETDAAGELSLTDLEWDIYDVELISSGYDIAEICQPTPLIINPGVSEQLFMTLAPASSAALNVLVTEADTTPVAGATVQLENTGIDQTSSTSLCGQAFFNSGLVADGGYTLTTSKPGYTTDVQTGVVVTSGSSTVQVILGP